MELFLWSVGSFHVFGEKVDPACVLVVRVQFFEKTQISSLLARCKVPSWAIFVSNAFSFSRKAFIFWRKAFILRSHSHCAGKVD